MGPKLARQGSGQADDSRLGGDVSRQAGRGDHPGYGAQVNDRALAGGDHSFGYGLNSEKLMPQVYVHGLVPIFRRDLGPIVAMIVGSVVHQDANRAKLHLELGDSRTQL